jgi:hypothetical protein
MTRLLLSLVLFASFSLSALAQSRPVAEPQQRVSELFTQCCAGRFPSIADDRGFVVFWSVDGRVMARRVSPSGQPQGTPAVLQDSAFAPTPVSDGSSILVFSTRTTDRVIQAQVVSNDLRELFGPVIVRKGSALAATFDGVDYILVSSEFNETTRLSELWLSRVARDGRLLASKRIDIEPAANVGSGVSIATNGSEFVVAWNDVVPVDCGPFPCIAPTRLRVITFDSDLELTALKGNIVDEEGYYPSVVWTGSRFVLVWTDLGAVLAQTVEPAMAATPGVVLDLPPADTIFLGSSAVWDGRNVVIVAYRAFSNGELYSVRLDGTGALVDPAGPFLVSSRLGYLTGILLSTRGSGVSLLTYLNGLQADGYAVVSSIIRNEPARGMRRAVRR